MPEHVQLQQAGAPGGPDGASFDVFLSHTSRDKPLVERIAERLKRERLEPWLDAWQLVPGVDWQRGLAAGLAASRSCAVFVGPGDLGAWEHQEVAVAIDRAAADPDFRLFLVLLPGLPEQFDASGLSPFLRLRTWVDYRRGLDDDRAFHALVSAVRGLPLGPAVPIEPETERCPYRGLEPFDEEHAEFFFGRDADVQRVLEKLKGTRFLAVLGASGSGKSSLVRAGVVPQLRRVVAGEQGAWEIAVLRPGPHPLEALAAQLLRLAAPGGMQETLDALAADPRSLHLAASLALADRPPETRLLLVVDQFEEVFTLCRDERVRAAFFANLLYAATVPSGRTVVLPTLRADFYHRCGAYPELAQQLAAEQYLVSPLQPEGLRQAIEEPARSVGLSFEPGLVATILEDVAQEPGALPLLEHALLEVWRRRVGGVLTLAAYRDAGGVEGAIAKRAEQVFEALEPEQQELARRAFLRLTQPGEGVEDTRRRAQLAELEAGKAEADVGPVLGRLVSARLLTTSRDEAAGADVVEVAHEALIRGWPRLRAWIEEDRAGLRVHRRLTEAALEWEHHGRDDDAFYRGARLAEALEWRAANEEELNSLEREFLDAAVALRDREAASREEQRQRELAQAQALAEEQQRRAAEHARSARRFRRLAVALLALLAAAIGATLFAADQRADAIAEKTRANPARLAAQSQASLADFPQRALLLAVEAQRAADAAGVAVAAADEALRKAVSSTGGTVIARHGNDVTATAVSGDNRRLAIGARDGSVQLVDVTPRGREPVVLRGPSQPVGTLAFGPEDGWLVVGHRELETSDEHDRTVRLWNLASAAETPVALPGADGKLGAALVSRDRRWVATVPSEGDGISLWDLSVRDPRERPHRLQVVRPDPAGTAFSSDGRWLVTVGRADTKARLWRLSADGPAPQPVVLPGKHATVVRDSDGGVVGRPPRDLFVVTRQTSSLWSVWKIAASRPLEPPLLVPGGEPPLLLTTSSDGRWLAAVEGFASGPVLWQLRRPRAARVTDLAPGMATHALSFAAGDDHVVAFGSYQSGLGGVAFVSDIAREVVPRLELTGTDLVITSDRRWLFAAVERTGVVDLVDLRTLGANRLAAGGNVSRLTTSSDGGWLAGSVGATVGMLDLRTHQVGLDTPESFWTKVMRGHDAPVTEVLISAEAKWLVTVSSDGTVRRWRLPGETNPQPRRAARLGSQQLLEQACRTAGRNLTSDEWRTYFPGAERRKTCSAFDLEERTIAAPTK